MSFFLLKTKGKMIVEMRVSVPAPLASLLRFWEGHGDPGGTLGDPGGSKGNHGSGAWSG